MQNPVKVELSDLKSGAADHLLDEAFGSDSLGIIIVDGLPAEYTRLRAKVLSDATRLSKLDDDVLARLESPEGHYLTGWSRGRERFDDNTYDWNKGSFYVNCSFHRDSELEGPPPEECESFENFKAYTTWNRWPGEVCGFEQDTKQLCNLIIDVAEVVAAACDRYCVEKVAGYQKGYLSHIVSTSTTTKARLLHYYPGNDRQWCGEHRDHSCLTGLTSAMFHDDENPDTEIACPDPESGLYIRDRHGQVVKVSIPKGCLAFQTGSALEEVSCGQFKAVPHYVAGCSSGNIARNTLAVFCQPSLLEMVTETENFAQYSERILSANE